MLANAKRIYALREFTVERRTKGWFFRRTYSEELWKGPYSSTTSVALMIARELMREITKRDEPFNVEA